jgi:tryptophanyl-tRNA synthetase
MNTTSKSRPARAIAFNPTVKHSASSIDALATTINRAIEQAEELGISSAMQLLMMARLEVDLTEIALETRMKNGA